MNKNYYFKLMNKLLLSLLKAKNSFATILFDYMKDNEE